MRYAYYVLLLLYVSIPKAYAQELPDKAVGKPDIFYIPIVGSDKSTSYSEVHDSYWEVYSDRDGNITYTSPGGTTVQNILGFMEKFRVAEIQGKYLHLFRETQSVVWPEISQSAINDGWIHKDNVMLWEHCLRNAYSLIDKKAMILRTTEGNKKASAKDLAVIKKNPELTINADITTGIFELFYVYKQTDKAVLLGNDIHINGIETDVKKCILGWVPVEKIVFWDYRIALEPNWEFQAAQERKGKDIQPAIFMSEKDAAGYKNGKSFSSKRTLWENDPGNYRKTGYWKRFPVLEVKENGIYHTVVLGGIISANGDISSDRVVEIAHAFNSLENNCRKINIVFVVNGTENVGVYYMSIYQALESSIQDIKHGDVFNQLKFGAVIYRDQGEKENPVEVARLTENYRSIINFLRSDLSVMKPEEDSPELMYLGLKSALTQVGFREGESNYIFLIGGAGNIDIKSKTRVSEKELISLLVQYDCSLLSYQVYNGADPTCQDFIDQSQNLILESAKLVQKKVKKYKSEWMDNEWSVEKPKILSAGTNKTALNPQVVIGSLLLPGKGQALSGLILENEIRTEIKRINNRTGLIISKALAIINGGGMDVLNSGDAHNIRPAVNNYLIKVNGLPDDEIKILKEPYCSLPVMGYTSKSVSKLGFPVFKEVLFLSRDDLQETIVRLKTLCEISGSIHERRQRMQVAWIDIMESILDPSNRDEIMAMTVDEANNIVFGLPVQIEIIGKVRLLDIIEPTVINDPLFEKYYSYMNNTLLNLSAIANAQNYIGSFISNSITYYWMPMDYWH